MLKRIVDRKLKTIKPSFNGAAMMGGGGSGAGILAMYYKCSCGQWIPSSIWELHKHKKPTKK